MINVTDSAIVNKIKGTGRTFTLSIVVGSNTYTMVKSLKRSSIFASSQKLSVGETVSAFIEAEIQNCRQSLQNYEVQPKLTIDGYTFNLGYFKVQAPSQADGSGTQKITAYDRMAETSKYTYTATGLTSAKSTFSAICSICGYTAVTSGLTDIGINDRLLDGMDCRKALGYIAGVFGKNCVVGTDGKFKMVGYSTVSESVCKISIDSLDTLEFPSQISTIDYFNAVVNDETAYKSGTGNNGVNIVNPLFTSITQTSNILTNLKSSVGGDGYYPAKFKQLNGDPRIEVGDVIKVEHRNLAGEVTADYVPVMSLTLDYDGGVTVSIEAYPTEDEFSMSLSDKVDFTNSSNNAKFEDINNKVDGFEEDINGANTKADFAVIQAQAVEELNKVVGNSLGLYQTKIQGAGGDTKYYFHNKETLAQSTYIISMTDQGFAFANSWNNGNPVWTYGINPAGNSIMNYLVVNKISADLIEAGVIRSLDGAPINTEFSLNTGLFSLESDSQKELFGFGTNRYNHLLLQYNYSDSQKNSIKLGYYYSGQFYKDSKYSEIIPASTKYYYGDMPSGNFYQYSSNRYTVMTDLTDVLKSYKGFILHSSGGSIGYTVDNNGNVQSDFNVNMDYFGGNLGIVDDIEETPEARTPILKFYDFENESTNGSSNYTAIRKQSITTRYFGARNISLLFDGNFIDLAWLLNSFLKTLNSYKSETDEALSSNQTQIANLNTKLTDYQTETNTSLASNQDQINTLDLNFKSYQTSTDALLTAYQAQINTLNTEIIKLKDFLGTQNFVVNVYANPADGGTITGGGIYSLSDEKVFIQVLSYSDYIISKVELYYSSDGFVTTYEGEDFTDPTVFSIERTVTAQRLGDTLNVYAYFKRIQPQTHIISTFVSPSGSGFVSGGGTYESGATATLTATPYNNYTFKQWSDGNTSNPRTITVNGDASYTAVFEIITNKYTLTLVADPSNGGTVSGGGTYDYETHVKITATPNSDYDFVGWYYSDGSLYSENTSTYVQMKSDIYLVAKFERVSSGNSTTIVTEVNNSSMGRATGDGTYIGGQSYTITATAYSGYIIEGVEMFVDGDSVYFAKEDLFELGLLDATFTNFSMPSTAPTDFSSIVRYKFTFATAQGGGDSGEGMTVKVSSSGAVSGDTIQLYDIYEDSQGIYHPDFSKPLGTTATLTTLGQAIAIYAEPRSGRKIESYETIIDGISYGETALNSTTSFDVFIDYEDSFNTVEIKFYFTSA